MNVIERMHERIDSLWDATIVSEVYESGESRKLVVANKD